VPSARDTSEGVTYTIGSRIIQDAREHITNTVPLKSTELIVAVLLLGVSNPLLGYSGSRSYSQMSEVAHFAVLTSGLDMSITEANESDDVISMKELQQRIDTPKVARQLYKRAVHEDRKGYHHQALSFAMEASRIAPDFYQAHAAMAAAYLRQGDLDAADSEIRVSLALNQHYLPAHELEGVLLYARGDLNEASEILTAFIKDASSRWIAHYFLGCALRDMGKGSLACEQFVTAARVRRHPEQLLPPSQDNDAQITRLVRKIRNSLRKGHPEMNRMVTAKPASGCTAAESGFR